MPNIFQGNVRVQNFFFCREGLRDNFVFREWGVYGLFLVILPREIIRYHDTEGRGPDVQPPLPPLDARMMSKEVKICEYTNPPPTYKSK